MYKNQDTPPRSLQQTARPVIQVGRNFTYSHISNSDKSFMEFD